MVVVFSAWGLGVAYGAIPHSACCGVADHAEKALAILNFPSWVFSALTAKALCDQDFIAFTTVKQLMWVALCTPQWWAYIAAFRFLSNRWQASP